MKNVVFFLLILASVIGCKTQKIASAATPGTIKGDTVKIANKELEYEVVIIDPGFNSWLYSRAYPRGYHSESFLEDKNRMYVREWNSRVLQPARYDSNLYEMQIDYDNSIHYGYEVNYLIYNYMVYFQNTHKQRLYGFVPPR